MKISFLCVLIAGLLPYLGTMAAKWGFRRYDNHNPRQWLGEQTGFRARGNAAQANSFEAFPFFAIGILFAMHSQVDASRIDLYASVFVVARMIYIVSYIIDQDKLRSLAWLVGLLSTIGLFSASMGS